MLAAASLPFEPQPLPPWRRQWFEGWFVRLVDHAARVSIALILGSMRLPRKEPALHGFHEHLLVLAYQLEGEHATLHTVIPGEHAALHGGGAALPSVRGPPPRFAWTSPAGLIAGSGDELFADVTVGGARLVANVSAPRVPWDPRAPHTAGPEGWLGRTGLLPCHYYVHSFASPTRYELRRGRRRTRGTASAHVERNYGDAFPRGWVWAQASAPAPRAVQLVLTGGRFIIGPLETESFVVGLRAADLGVAWDFRTTDADAVAHARRPCEARLALNATSRDGTRRLLVTLRARRASFGGAIPVPTSQGFSAEPGCRESYSATAELVAVARASRRAPWQAPLLQLQVPMAVLEYGGDYQC